MHSHSLLVLNEDSSLGQGSTVGQKGEKNRHSFLLCHPGFAFNNNNNNNNNLIFIRCKIAFKYMI